MKQSSIFIHGVKWKGDCRSWSASREADCWADTARWNSPYMDMLNIGSPRSRKLWRSVSLSTIYLRSDRRQETMQRVNPTNTPVQSKQRAGEQGKAERRARYVFQCTDIYHFRPCLPLLFHFPSWTHLSIFHEHCDAHSDACPGIWQ